ncbi:unnamed protein product, partial [Mesorhabditis spiculigera]
MQKWPTVTNDLDLNEGKINFTTRTGDEVTIKAIWQDTLPLGSHEGTIFAIHGSPGSHNDFKYIAHYLKKTGIRVIAMNMPGHGYTQKHKKIGFENEDRNAFLQAMLDHLQIEGPIVFVGHSRGSENAMAIYAQGIKPFFIIQFASWIYNVNLWSVQKMIMHPILYHVYKRIVRLKTQTGKIAAVCVQSMRTFGLEKQRPYVEELNENSKTPIVMAYSGKDFLIEDQIVREMLAEFDGAEELILDDSKSDDVEAKAARWVRQRLLESRALGVCFKQDGHYLQKFKAKFLADTIATMCQL